VTGEDGKFELTDVPPGDIICIMKLDVIQGKRPPMCSVKKSASALLDPENLEAGR